MPTFVSSTNETHHTIKEKRIPFLFVALFASTLLYSQAVGVKMNVTTDALEVINFGTEVGLNKELILDLYTNYNPRKYKDQRMMRMSAFQPELRHWFCDKFNGRFAGMHLHGGIYQAAAVGMPWGIWPELKEHHFKGHFYSLGVSCGYQWTLGRYWNFEGSVGVSYACVKYEQFEYKICGEKAKEGHKNYVGPTRAAVSLIHLF